MEAILDLSEISTNVELMQKKPQDAILLEWQEIQAAQRDPTLFRPLYERHYEKVFRFIHARTNDEFLSADICSQVFLKVIQNLSSYKFMGSPFSAWLFRIASNEIIQHYRQTQKTKVIGLEEVDLMEMAEELEEDFKKEKIAGLLKILQTLPPSEMEMLQMRYFEKRPFKEVADILGISENNAKVKMHRIIDRLKRKML